MGANSFPWRARTDCTYASRAPLRGQTVALHDVGEIKNDWTSMLSSNYKCLWKIVQAVEEHV